LLVVLDLVRSDRLGHEPWALDFGDYFDLNMLVTVRKKQLRLNSARKGAALWLLVVLPAHPSRASMNADWGVVRVACFRWAARSAPAASGRRSWRKPASKSSASPLAPA
jgi:hypothetical protein